MKILVTLVLLLSGECAFAQMSADEAMAKLRQRERLHTQTQPTTTPATQPVASAPKKIAFVLQVGGGMLNRWDDVRTETLSAIATLGPSDRFNIFYDNPKHDNVLAKLYFYGTDKDKLAVQKFFDGTRPMGGSILAPSLSKALETNPDTIWVASNGDLIPKERAACLDIVLKPHTTSRTKINAALFAPKESDASPAALFLWDLAHAREGICVDKDGIEITNRPVAPVPKVTAPPPPPPAPQKPNIFK